MFEEKRKHTRARQPIVLRFRMTDDKRSDDPRNWNLGVIENMGAGGVLFSFEKKIPVGSILEMNIDFSMEDMPLRTKAEVVRAEKYAYTEMYFLAVRFVKYTVNGFVDISYDECDPQNTNTRPVF